MFLTSSIKRLTTTTAKKAIAMKKNLVVSLPVEMYDDFKKSSMGMGRTLSEMTREMITAFNQGDLRIKKDMLEYDRQVELGRKLYGTD